MQDIEKLKREITADETDAINVQNYVAQFQIENNEQLEPAVHMIAEIKAQGRALEEQKESWTKPLREVIVSIQEAFAPALAALREAEYILKSKVVAHIESQLEKRDAMIETIAELPEEQRSAALAKAEALQPPRVPGLQIRETIRFEVTHRTALLKWIIDNNLDFLDIDFVKLNTFTQANIDISIPGYRKTIKRVVAVSK